MRTGRIEHWIINFFSNLQDVREIEGDEKLFESLLERRMNIELTDYPGTGANNNHDPKTPGRIWILLQFYFWFMSNQNY